MARTSSAVVKPHRFYAKKGSVTDPNRFNASSYAKRWPRLRGQALVDKVVVFQNDRKEAARLLEKKPGFKSATKIAHMPETQRRRREWQASRLETRRQAKTASFRHTAAALAAVAPHDGSGMFDAPDNVGADGERTTGATQLVAGKAVYHMTLEDPTNFDTVTDSRGNALPGCHLAFSPDGACWFAAAGENDLREATTPLEGMLQHMYGKGRLDQPHKFLSDDGNGNANLVQQVFIIEVTNQSSAYPHLHQARLVRRDGGASSMIPRYQRFFIKTYTSPELNDEGVRIYALRRGAGETPVRMMGPW